MDPWFMWAVGLFEGEGCIHVAHHKSQRRQYAYLRLQIGMADEMTVRKFHEVVECGRMYGPYQFQTPGHLPMWWWHLTRKAEAAVLLDRMLPFLGPRRQAQAAVVLAEIEAVSLAPTTPRPLNASPGYLISETS